MRRIVLSLLILLLAGALPARAETRFPVLMQVLVGAGAYDRDSLSLTKTTSDGTATEDLSSQPVLGVVGQYPLSLGRGEFGFETSALYGWRSRSTTIASNLNQTSIHIETSFWLLDLAAGLYAASRADARWRFYLAGGPVLLFAEEREDRNAIPAGQTSADSSDRSRSEFGAGGYLRAGLDYQLTPGGYIGLCVRGVASSLAFEPPTGSGTRVSGVQGFVTFSRWF